MKRRIFAGIILAVELLMVMLWVVPHHHHGDRICFTSESFCAQSCPSESCEKHACHGRDKDCDLQHRFEGFGRTEGVGHSSCTVSSDHPSGVFFVWVAILPGDLPEFLSLAETSYIYSVSLSDPVDQQDLVANLLRGPPAFIAC